MKTNTEGATEMTEKQHSFECAHCGQTYGVTESQFEAHGWVHITDVHHVECTATRRPHDPFDWSQASDAEVREMERQLLGGQDQ